jgi:hypothetical protein
MVNLGKLLVRKMGKKGYKLTKRDIEEIAETIHSCDLTADEIRDYLTEYIEEVRPKRTVEDEEVSVSEV